MELSQFHYQSTLLPLLITSVAAVLTTKVLSTDF